MTFGIIEVFTEIIYQWHW